MLKILGIREETSKSVFQILSTKATMQNHSPFTLPPLPEVVPQNGHLESSADASRSPILTQTTASRAEAPSVTLTRPDEESLAVGGNLMVSPLEQFPSLESNSSRPRTPSTSDGRMDEQQLRMKTVWEESIHKNLNVANEYDRVGVLVVKWLRELEDQRSGEEVMQLEQVLREDFHFETQVVELSNRDRLNPHSTLQYELVSFVRKFETPDMRNLMIVIYSG